MVAPASPSTMAARDMVVDDASFVNNNGPGISALWGITAVTASDFVNNHGAGATFQNYGNFDDNTFSTSGSQTIGMSAYLVNTATLVNNASMYTGGGSDPTVRRHMRGPGGLFVAGDSGPIVTEPSVQTGPILASVLVGTQGVAVPTLAPVTAATTAPGGQQHRNGALETALKTAMASGTVVHLTDATYNCHQVDRHQRDRFDPGPGRHRPRRRQDHPPRSPTDRP